MGRRWLVAVHPTVDGIDCLLAADVAIGEPIFISAAEHGLLPTSVVAIIGSDGSSASLSTLDMQEHDSGSCLLEVLPSSQATGEPRVRAHWERCAAGEWELRFKPVLPTGGSSSVLAVLANLFEAACPGGTWVLVDELMDACDALCVAMVDLNPVLLIAAKVRPCRARWCPGRRCGLGEGWARLTVPCAQDMRRNMAIIAEGARSMGTNSQHAHRLHEVCTSAGGGGARFRVGLPQMRRESLGLAVLWLRRALAFAAAFLEALVEGVRERRPSPCPAHALCGSPHFPILAPCRGARHLGRARPTDRDGSSTLVSVACQTAYDNELDGCHTFFSMRAFHVAFDCFSVPRSEFLAHVDRLGCGGLGKEARRSQNVILDHAMQCAEAVRQLVSAMDDAMEVGLQAETPQA